MRKWTTHAAMAMALGFLAAPLAAQDRPPYRGGDIPNDYRYDDRYDDRYNTQSSYWEGQVVEASNSLTRDIRVALGGRDEVTVSVPRDARITRDGRGISVHEIRRNDWVRLEVDMERYRRDNEVVAQRIEVSNRSFGGGREPVRGQPWEYPNNGRPGNYPNTGGMVNGRWSGEVTDTTGRFTRTIKVRFTDGTETSVDVPSGARVRRDGRDISVHELRSGDWVTLEINEDKWRRERKMEANRVDASDSSYDGRPGTWPDTRPGTRPTDRPDWRGGSSNDPWDDRYENLTRREGEVRDVNERDGILRLDSSGRVVTVWTDGARFTRDGRTVRIEDIRVGDRVRVEGREDGARLYARDVTVLR